MLVDVDEEGEYEIDLGAELLDSADEVIGDSWKFGVEVNNFYVEKEAPKVEEEGTRKRFGKRLRETTNTNRQRVSEFLLTGIDQLVTPFDEEDVKDALRMREVAIEEAKKRAEERQDAPAAQKPSRGITRSRGGETTSTESSAPVGRTRTRRF